MANWVRSFLEHNPDRAAMPVFRRARHALHFRRPDGLVEAHFTGAPMHHLDGARGWQPIDTALLAVGDGSYGAAHSPVRLRPDGLVAVGGYNQLTRRVGILNTNSRKFSAVHTLPVSGLVNDDRIIREGGIWRHDAWLTASGGYHEELTLQEWPNVSTGTNDWLVLETVLSGVSFPDGWLDEFETAGYRFPLPTVRDASGRPAPAKRYARTTGGVQYVYTGVPVSWLASAVYPVTIDPDFTGLTADGYVQGNAADYTTAHTTSATVSAGVGWMYVGQDLQAGPSYRVYRGFLKFDTSTIGASSTVNQVTLTIRSWGDISTTDFDVQIVKQDWSGQDPLSDANREAAYDNCFSGTLDDSIWRNTAGLVTETWYTSGNLATAWVSKTGDTYYSLRSSRDASETSPTGSEYIYVYSANQAAKEPYLTVLYSEGNTTGTGAVVLAPATIAAVSAESFAGESVETIQPALLTAAGTLSLSASGAVSAPAPSSVGAGEETFSGAGAATVVAPSLSGTASTGATGTVDMALQPIVMVGAGAESFSGIAAVTVASIEIDASAAAAFSGTGSSRSEPASITGYAESGASGSGSVAGQTTTLTATGEEVYDVAGSQVAASPQLSAVGALAFSAIGVVSAQAATLVAEGAEIATGTGSVEMAPSAIDATGAVVPPALTGTAAIVVWSPNLAGTAALSISGTGAAATTAPSISAAAVEEFRATAAVVATVASLASVAVQIIAGTGRVETARALLAGIGAITTYTSQVLAASAAVGDVGGTSAALATNAPTSAALGSAAAGSDSLGNAGPTSAAVGKVPVGVS